MIKSQDLNSITLDELKIHFKRYYTSKDYLVGFCDAYFMGKYELWTIAKLEQKFNGTLNINDKYFILFVEVDTKGDN